jgi:hypothetical protein
MGHFLVPYIAYEYTKLAHERGTKSFPKGGVHPQNPSPLCPPLCLIFNLPVCLKHFPIMVSSQALIRNKHININNIEGILLGLKWHNIDARWNGVEIRQNWIKKSRVSWYNFNYFLKSIYSITSYNVAFLILSSTWIVPEFSWLHDQFR